MPSQNQPPRASWVLALVVFALQLLAVYLPFTEDFFKVVLLTLLDLLVCGLLAEWCLPPLKLKSAFCAIGSEAHPLPGLKLKQEIPQ